MNTAKNTNPDILPIWQNVGESTYRITNAVAEKYGVKATHTGVLDPMAQGVVLVLLGEERLKKMEHTDWLKEYEFDILFGISTDTYDGLGLITQKNFDAKVRNIESVLQSFVGNYSQKVPAYSATKVLGKKLFIHAKSGEGVPELPTKSGVIHEISLVKTEIQSLQENIEKVISNINKVVIGDFRQKEIIEQWSSLKEDPQLICVTVKVLMTRGLYVRSLSQDIASKLNVPGFVTKLVRTKNGPYARQDCIEVATLVEL